MKRFNVPFILLGIIILISSCSSNKKNEESITFGVMSSMDYLPLAVAEREGYFTKHGITVKIQKFLSANERDAAIQSGVVDGTVTDYTSAALVNAAGFKLKLTSKCQAPFYIVAGSESGVNNLSELKGKKIAVSQNTVIDFCVDMALQSVGLNQNDVQKIEVNKIPLRLEMMRNNKIDATGLPNPFALIAKNDNCKLIASMDSLGYTVTGMAFTEKAIENKSENIKKMYAAYNDGAEYLRTHSIEDIRDILTKDLGFPQALIEQVEIPAYTEAKPLTISDSDLQAVIKWLADRKLIDNSFNINELIDSNLTK